MSKVGTGFHALPYWQEILIIVQAIGSGHFRGKLGLFVAIDRRYLSCPSSRSLEYDRLGA